jgi:hypothetical protein
MACEDVTDSEVEKLDSTVDSYAPSRQSSRLPSKRAAYSDSGEDTVKTYSEEGTDNHSSDSDFGDFDMEQVEIFKIRTPLPQDPSSSRTKRKADDPEATPTNHPTNTNKKKRIKKSLLKDSDDEDLIDAVHPLYQEKHHTNEPILNTALNLNWSRDPVVESYPGFLFTGPAPGPTRPHLTVLDAFKSLLTDNIIDKIVLESNQFLYY